MSKRYSHRLADTLNVNRSALGRTLKALQDEGVLRVERNTFEIISPEPYRT